jgi:CHAT domain-containing protein
MLACSPEAEILPWEWLIVEGTPMCLRCAVARRSVGLSEKARGLRFVGQPLRALVIGDTGEGSANFPSLPSARREAEEVKKVIEGQSEGGTVTLLLGKDASYERVIREVERGEYDIIHFAGVAGCDDSESFLVMNDGHVRSSELVSLLNRRPPAFMMLNSELTAFVPPIEGFSGEFAARSGNGQWPLHANARGFDRMAARAGVSAFIGVFRGALEDEPAAKLATATYSALLDGLPTAQALLRARKDCVRFNDVTGCFYTLSGHPHLRLADHLRQVTR